MLMCFLLTLSKYQHFFSDFCIVTLEEGIRYIQEGRFKVFIVPILKICGSGFGFDILHSNFSAKWECAYKLYPEYIIFG